MNWLRNMSIMHKVILLITFGVAALLGVGATGYLFLHLVSGNGEEMHETALKASNLLEAELRFLTVERNTKELMLAPTAAERNRLAEQIREGVAENDAMIAQFEALELTAREQELLRELKSAVERYRPERVRAQELAMAGQPEAAYNHFQQHAAVHLEQVRRAYDLLTNLSFEAIGDRNNESVRQANLANMMMIGIIALASALSVSIGILLSRMISSPVRDMMELMARAENRDLTVKGDYLYRDEVGQLTQSFNKMIEGLRSVVSEVGDNAGVLAASAQQISAGTEEIAGGSQTQAESASSASEMMKEMTSAVQQVARNAEQAALLAEDAVKKAEHGGGVIRETMQGMQSISTRMEDLSDKSAQIGDIIDMIDEIAEQTNLLALNAAIEAARAGDAGRGFAVVADEVRKLAERSGKATKEIGELIRSIKENTERAMHAVRSGDEQTQRAGTAFEEIMQIVKESAVKVVEIAAASEEQSAQAGEMARVVENIAAITEETTAGTEETAATASELSKMAEALNELTQRFKIR